MTGVCGKTPVRIAVQIQALSFTNGRTGVFSIPPHARKETKARLGIAGRQIHTRRRIRDNSRSPVSVHIALESQALRRLENSRKLPFTPVNMQTLESITNATNTPRLGRGRIREHDAEHVELFAVS